MRGGVADLDGHHVARADRTVPVETAKAHVAWRCEVNQAVIPRPAGEPVGRAILAAFALRDKQLDHSANLPPVLLPRDVVLQRDQPLVALLNDLLRYLRLHLGSRR